MLVFHLVLQDMKLLQFHGLGAILYNLEIGIDPPPPTVRRIPIRRAPPNAYLRTPIAIKEAY